MINDKNYAHVHYWIKKIYGKATMCEVCGCLNAKKYEWALKDGCSYDKNRDNFMQMCKSCHIKHDMTEKTIEKFRINKTGLTHTEETKLKMSNAHKLVNKSYLVGRKLSQETKNKISMALTGISKNAGKPLTEKHRKAISEGMKKSNNVKTII